MTYTDLKADVIRHIRSPALAAEAGNFVANGEKTLNRKLPELETDATLAATIGSRTVNLAAIAIKTPLALFIKDGAREIEINSVAEMPRSDDAGRPQGYEANREAITFNRPADQAYALRLRYVQKFELSDDVTTNWLLEEHYDAYLAAAMVWAYARKENPQMAGQWERKLNSLIPQIRTQIASFKKSDLQADPALLMIARGHRNYGIC